MPDDLSLFQTKRPRRAGPAEEARFRAAFAKVLAADPDHAPGPTALAREMGWSNRQLNGRVTGLRRALLREAGFRFNETLGRFVR